MVVAGKVFYRFCKEWLNKKNSSPNVRWSRLHVKSIIPAADVYGTATFYSFLETKPAGKIYYSRMQNHYLCDERQKPGFICHTRHAENQVRGKPPPTNNLRCWKPIVLGWCHKAPAMLINDEILYRTHTRKSEGNFNKLHDRER